MKRPYEVSFIVRIESSSGDEAINDQITQVQSWIETGEYGQVTKIDRWGRRKLAYEIDRQREGYYVIMEANIDPQGLPEVERNMKLSPAVLRYLIIRADE
ncbi:MAG: 30S ribosomal protein S6 [Anaerolineae bacterium]|nr:30S ribosomal protein S6 [Anaerolineae bacterium]